MSSQLSIPNYSSRGEEWMETRQHFVHNQTRKSILSWNVVVGDFSFPSLSSWMSELTPNSGLGIWIRPFKGFPPINESVALDLVYLDTSGRVIDLVRSYSHSHPRLSSQPAASVLAVPSAVILSSDTHRGDLLIVCAADEFMNLQNLDAGAKSRPIAVASPHRTLGQSNVRTLRSPDCERSQLNNPTGEAAHFATPALIDSIEVKQSANTASTLRSCLARWSHLNLLNRKKVPDRRKVTRKAVDNLVASFWTGGAPTVHAIRDISSTGFYLVTAERWYLGTVVRMTLTNTDPVNPGSQMSICVRAETIRWGNDGVGLRFVVESAREKNAGQRQFLEGADREQLNQFLQQTPA